MAAILRTPVVLLASTALVLPAAVLAAPVEAASEATTAKIANCSKTKHGVTTRIKLRVEGRYMRVRVSHPRGTGNFKNRQVKRVVLIASQVSPISISRGKRFGDKPVYRLRNFNAVSVKFTLRNGHSTGVSCMYPTAFPPCPQPTPEQPGVVC